MTKLIQNELDKFVKRILDYYNTKNPIMEKTEAYSWMCFNFLT